MTHSRQWQVTQQQAPHDEPTGGGTVDTASTGLRAGSTDDGDFAPTEPSRHADLDPRWWSEAADGQCSEEAAQFAASQPAPLSIV